MIYHLNGTAESYLIVPHELSRNHPSPFNSQMQSNDKERFTVIVHLEML